VERPSVHFIPSPYVGLIYYESNEETASQTMPQSPSDNSKINGNINPTGSLSLPVYGAVSDSYGRS
jgi:hypothetical protein